MTLTDQLTTLFTDFSRRKTGFDQVMVESAYDPWDIRVVFAADGGVYSLSSLVGGNDNSILHEFGEGLGERSRYFFGPYPWNDPIQLQAAYREAIRKSIERIDAAYLLCCGSHAIGHCFLWKAGGHPISQAYGLEVPELGIALADYYQGRGLGGLQMAFLEIIARHLGADAIELTTALDNENGWQTYLKAGYTYQGIFRIPLNVDVTAVEAGEVTAEHFRDERHMVRILNPEKEAAVVRYLAGKRGE